MPSESNDPVVDWPLGEGDPGREVWYSLLSTEGGRQEDRLWAALTDREEPDDSTFVPESFPLEDVRPGTDPFELTVGDATLTSSSAAGASTTSRGASSTTPTRTPSRRCEAGG